LSQDEIVFEEIRYREPVRTRRPDRDRKWACLAYEVPGPDDLPVFLDRAAADAIERHALRDTSVELGGILLGKECVDDQTGVPFVWVTKSLEAKHYENTQASFTYTHDSWEEITRERDRLHPDLDVVGWYHTHPDFGVFLSSHDLFIQRHFFAQPLQLAYVVDPVRQTRGFFRWRGGSMEQTGGFYLVAGRGERAALARLANDLENLPNTDPTGGGGLSPRLEAELIAMLTRPTTTHYPATAADRAQTALVFALLGATLGVIALGAVLWLSALNNSVQLQAKALEELRKTVTEASERQRVVLDAAVGDPGGAGPQKFLERYERAAHDRDDFKGQVASQAVATACWPTRSSSSPPSRPVSRPGSTRPPSSKRRPRTRPNSAPASKSSGRPATSRPTGSPTSSRCSTPPRVVTPPRSPPVTNGPGTSPPPAGPSARSWPSPSSPSTPTDNPPSTSPAPPTPADPRPTRSFEALAVFRGVGVGE
jgi:proteasome lid subunit RPN8/RPN11